MDNEIKSAAEVTEDEDLDEELIQYLNERYGQSSSDEMAGPKSNRIRLVGFFTVIVFLALAFSNWGRLISIQPPLFLNRSYELIQDAEIRKMREAVVVISTGNTRGTGFNVDAGGLIITNQHMVKEGENIIVTFAGGATYRGSMAVSFPELDLAVIDINGTGLPVLEIESGRELLPGDEVIIIGNPLSYSRIVMEGEIVDFARLIGWDVPVVLISAPIHKGSSGSPVINADGKAAAVVFATLASNTASDDIIGLAVSLKHIYQEILLHQAGK